MNDRITISIEDHVAQVRMIRTDKINAIDLAMFEALVDAARQLGEMRGVRAVVLSGAGRGFCVGIDTDALTSIPALKDLLPRTHGAANLFQAAVWTWRQLPIPVIAAVHGFAFGGGFQLMLGADMRVIAPDAKLSLMEAKYALIPDMAGIGLLRNLVRDDIARDLIFTGRILTGTEGERLGLATRLAEDPLAEATAMAQAIARNSPRQLAVAKRLINRAADDALTADALLLAEAELQMPLIAGDDHSEAVAAAREKRLPAYRD